MTAARPASIASLPASSKAVTVVKCSRPVTRARSPSWTSKAAVGKALFNCGSSMRAHSGAIGAHLALGFHSRDHLVQSLLLDLGSKICAKALHVGDALDYDVPGFPPIGCLAQTEVHRHLRAGCARHLSANRCCRIPGIASIR